MNRTPLDDFLSQPVGRFVQTTYDCEESTPAETAQAYLGRSPMHVVLVTADGTKRLTGILTVADLAKPTSARGPRTARQLATMGNIVAVTDNTSVRDVLTILEGGNSLKLPLKQVPVVNSARDAVGVITRDYLRQLMSSFQVIQRNSLSW